MQLPQELGTEVHAAGHCQLAPMCLVEIHTYLRVCSPGIEDGSLKLSCMPRETGSDQEAILNKTGLMYILHFVDGSSWEAKLSADMLEIHS